MKFLKGLYKDSALIDQPQSTHRDALNMIMNLEKGSISTEYGNTASTASVRIQTVIDNDRKINGSVLLPDNKFLLFYSSLYSDGTSTSYIYLFDPEGDLMTLVFATSNNFTNLYYNIEAGHLNFTPDYPITGETKVAANGDIVIYFTDNYKNVKVEPVTGIEYIESYNPPRAFNLTRQLLHIKSGNDVNTLYEANATINTKHVDYLNIFLTSSRIPQVVTHHLVKGGVLETGAYYLGLAYATEDFTETNIYTLSQPVYIPVGNYASATANVGVTPSTPFEHMTGAPAGTQTTFGIQWEYTVGRIEFDPNYTDYDKNYKYVVPYIIKLSGTARTAYKLPLVPLSQYSGIITFNGNENYSTSSVEEIVLDKATYLTAKTLTQLDNKLYLGNLTARKDIGFQRFASNIKTVPVVKKIQRFDARVFDSLNLNYGYTQILKKYEGTYEPDFNDYKLINTYYAKYQTSSIYDGDSEFWTYDGAQWDPNTTIKEMGGYRNQHLASYLKSYRRGEVYALYISFVLNDGTETYAYHIPGRNNTQVYFHEGLTSLPISESDIDFTAVNINNLYFLEQDGSTQKEVGLTNKDLQDRLGTLYRYSKIYDTSKEILPERITTDETNSMGFWRNENEIYPETADFVSCNVDAAGNPTYSGVSSLAGASVRHHKFPSNLNRQFTYIDHNRTNLYRVHIPATVTPNGLIEQSLLVNLRTATASWDDQVNQSAFFYENVNILGFQLKNIKIPKFILGQVQGFKVYYAKRTLENKTILGQSLVHPSFFRATGFFSNTRLALSNKVFGPFYRYWSFYANIPDVLSASADSYIKYNSFFFGNGHYEAGTLVNAPTYSGSPIVKFHDFTMLRKKINLSIVDYISIQSMVTMHQYNGLLRNAALDASSRDTEGPIYNVDYLQGYKYFQTGQNENEEFSWIHADFNNLDSKVARATSTGTLDSFAPHRGPYAFRTNVMIGARYTTFAQGVYEEMENSQAGFANPFKPHALANVFTITNNGASYINGLSYLRVTDVDSFHGAQYLDNYGGETAIALSLKSGLPQLYGYVTDTATFDSNHYDTESVSGSILSALDTNKNPDETYSTLGRGKANIFLANLHSYKTDVFNPFDNQTLVWTGYYHPLQITPASLDTGAIGGATGCIHFLTYTPINEIPPHVTLDGSTSTLNITYDLDEGTGPQMGHLDLACTTSNDIPLVPGGVYNYVITISDPEAMGSLDSFLPVMELTLGGGSMESIGVDGTTDTYTGTVTCGVQNFLRFDLGTQTIYKYGISITITKDNPSCVDTYKPAILKAAFQYSPDGFATDYNAGNNYYTGFQSGWIFGGDTFIARYNYRMTSMDFPNYYLEQNITQDDHNNKSTITTGYGQQMSLPESIRTTIGPLASTTPYNDYLGVVAFMNVRVVRTFGTDIWPNVTAPFFNLLQNFISIQVASPITSGNPDGMYRLENFQERNAVVAFATLYSVFVESDDNLNFRHAGDVVKGVGKEKSLFFDGYTAADVLFRSPLIDLTKQDNLLYEDHYSALQDIKTTVPFPKKGEIETAFPSRVVRSNVQTGGTIDNYRHFLALQYKDFSQNKGAVTNLAALTGLLFIHTEKSLYKTTGKQTVQLGDTSEAFIGSGDIFMQEPLELVTANEGYGGTFNKHSCVINKYGYLYVSRKEKKIFLLSDKLTEISQLGMENWFRLNIPYTLETTNANNPFPINLDTIPYLNLDSPTGAFGFITTYDPLFKRFVITKKEVIPSDDLLSILNRFLIFPVGDTSDPHGCLSGNYNLTVNPSIPLGTGVGIINGSTALLSPYVAPTDTASIWFDPNLGAYILNSILHDQLFTDLGSTVDDHLTTVSLPIYNSNTESCETGTFYAINIANDNYWFKENGWTISYYPDNQSWISRHSYVSPWYFYNSENFFSFQSYANSANPQFFKIWRHNNTNGAKFYNTDYNYEFEFVINDSPELTKIMSSVSIIADVFYKDETGTSALTSPTSYLKDKFTAYNIELPFTSFYVYNTYQNSGVINFEYLNNIRRVEGSWVFNNFRDLVKYTTSTQLSDDQQNISGGFNNNVQTPYVDYMFLDEGSINPIILDTAKPWYEQKKFMAKFFAIRLIGQGNNNLVNLYSATAALRKSSR